MRTARKQDGTIADAASERASIDAAVAGRTMCITSGRSVQVVPPHARDGRVDRRSLRGRVRDRAVLLSCRPHDRPLATVLQGLRARAGVGPEQPPHGRGHRLGPRLADPSHRHAQMLRFDEHEDAPRRQGPLQRVRDLRGEALLTCGFLDNRSTTRAIFDRPVILRPSPARTPRARGR